MIQQNCPAAGRPLAQADASCDSEVNKLRAAKVRWQVREESCDSTVLELLRLLTVLIPAF